MVGKEKKLLKNALLFSTGNAGAKLLMLIIVPLYTYYVSVEQMGQYDVINTYVGLFAPLACIALYEGLYRWLLDDVISNEDVLKTGVTLVFIFISIFDILAFVLLYIIKFPYFIEFILLINATCFYTVVQFITRGLRNNKIYAVQGIIYSIILIICNLVLVVSMRLETRGLLLSMIIAYFATTIFMVVFQSSLTKSIWQGRVDRRIAFDLIKYSIPIMPNNIAWWLVLASNRVIISWNMGYIGNGVYAISMKFPTLVNMLSTFFYQAWQEQAISEYDSRERDIYYSKILNMYVKLLFGGILMLLPITKFIIIFFMNRNYSEAYHYIGFLYMSSVFNALAAFYGTGYLSTKKTAGALTTTILGATVNVLFTLSAIDKLGLNAAAIGSMLGNLVIWITRIIHTKKYFCIKLNKRYLCFLVLINLISIILVNRAGLTLMIVYQILFSTLFLYINKELVIEVLGMVKLKSR